MESSHNTPPAPIDLFSYINRFLKTLRYLWLLIPVLALLFSARSFFGDRVSYSPRYACTAILSVGSEYASDDIFSGSSFYSDTAAAEALASAFPNLLSTDYMRDLIKEELNGGAINGSIQCSLFEGTNMVELSVTSSDPQAAYDILNAVIVSFPRAAVYLVDNPSVMIHRAPEVPTQPINVYSPGNSWIRGAAKGSILAVGVIFLLSLLNQAIGNSSDLKKLINVPIVGTLPQISLKKRRSKIRPFVTAASNPALRESLRSLRAKVHRLLDASGGNIILLTSTIPGEGKTTVSTNLALSLAEEGHKVILVDADLRKQTIAQQLKSTTHSRGLLYCLNNPEQISECVKEAPNSTLHYLSGGVIQKRHYAIDSKALNRVFRTLSQSYDYVVVDTPPCAVVSDTRVLCQHADCVLYVVKTDGASKLLIHDAISGLHQHGITLSGCILNGAGRDSSHYGYYGRSKYGYGKNRRDRESMD